ncbi:MAG TPA: hypothetical protein VGA56_19805 [Opitutaceae bacterium]
MISIPQPFPATADRQPPPEVHQRLVNPWVGAIPTGLSIITALVVGFVLVSPKPVLDFVQHAGYYVIALGCVAWVIAVARMLKSARHVPTWGRADLALIGASLAAALLWQVNMPHGFKVLLDELVVSATAMSMHFDREIFVPLKIHVVDGYSVVLDGIVDKRLSFFAFLLSLLYGLTGYRTANVFVLNAAISAVLLYLAGRFGRRLGGQDCAGLLVVVLLGGLPLLGLNATSGNFEALNLLMICACMLAAHRFLARPDAIIQDVLVLGAVLLAQTRYESVLFVAPVGAVVLWGWWKLRRPIWSWGLFAAPLLLILVPLQSKVFAMNANGYWQLTNGLEKPFMLKFFTENLGHAILALFVLDGRQMGSPMLSLAGVVCTVFVFVFLLRRPRQLASCPGALVLAGFGLVVAANFGLVLCYHWGQLDDFVAMRLALPLMLFFALAAAFACGRWIRRAEIWIPVLALPVAWTLLAGVPMAANSMSTESFLSYQETKWQRRFVREKRDEHALFAMASPIVALNERKAGLSTEALAERAGQMAWHLEQRSYQDVYVFQRLSFDATSEQWVADERNRLGPEFMLETIEERRFKPAFKMRLSRLLAVDLNRQLPRPSDWQAKFPQFLLPSPENDVGPEERYTHEYLSMLP